LQKIYIAAPDVFERDFIDIEKIYYTMKDVLKTIQL